MDYEKFVEDWKFDDDKGTGDREIRVDKEGRRVKERKKGAGPGARPWPCDEQTDRTAAASLCNIEVSFPFAASCRSRQALCFRPTIEVTAGKMQDPSHFATLEVNLQGNQ
ncbi:hypothetical protein WR25_18492 [Diploscapter pachys]|uniref:Uncharacterized protein n=1 Tax=Diploscapter pachys TaxID=2018661 RepID=A0A2A2JTZ2_9BILA|nr:hypothetical protein WR25_18492 [Diploscapter pachys]